MKKFIAIACLLAGFAACGTTDETGDVYVTDAVTDTTPACTASAQDLQDACFQIRDAVCARLVTCATYATTAECIAWWDNPDNYGKCEDTSASALGNAATYLQPCVCGLPAGVCTTMSASGFETAVPSCDSFFKNLPQ